MRKYRPSNGTDGDCFMSQFCSHCTKDTEENPCEILGRSLAYSIDDPSYPTEWIEDERGPRCTAFTTPELEEVYRCDETPDLFAEAS